MPCWVGVIDLLRKASSQYVAVEERVFNDTVQQSINLARNAARRSANFHAAGAKVYRELKSERYQPLHRYGVRLFAHFW
jgi:hypothetical protein